MIMVDRRGRLITEKRNAFLTYLLDIRCAIFHHDLKVTRRISKTVGELYCCRCKREFAINTEVKAFIPLCDEIRALHDSML